MNLFGNPDERVPNLLIAGAALVMLGAACYDRFVPAPDARSVGAGRARSRNQIQQDIDTAKKSLAEAEGATRPRLWTGEIEAVTATLLSRLTSGAQARKVTLGAFRPQKPRTVDTLTELAFSVQVSGPYPAVLAFVRDLEKPGLRATARAVQVASADAASDAVTATVALVAYLAPSGPSDPANPRKKGAPTVASRRAEGGRDGQD